MNDANFYIYSFKNGKINIRPHKYNPTGNYPDDRFNVVDVDHEMFGRTNDLSDEFASKLTRRLLDEKSKKYAEISKLITQIDDIDEQITQITKERFNLC